MYNIISLSQETCLKQRLKHAEAKQFPSGLRGRAQKMFNNLRNIKDAKIINH